MALRRYDLESPRDQIRELPACGCGTLLRAKPLGRRRFLGLTLATVGAGAMLPGLASAAEPGKSYAAMLLTCIDPRFVTSAREYMVGTKHWKDNYSLFSFAGAAVGAVAPKLEGWHQTFWDNLAITIQLHQIKNLVALDHRDCGAAELAYGKDAVATPKAETETHRKVLTEFRAEVGKRHPQLRVVTGLIAKSGKVEMLG
ncbi:MAG TPA: hypothetical protein VMQ11_14635 [Alphaproteobacteria bacterium]|nr:hypothetical protein [Alphaproteobacteria bacterium]